LVVDDDLGVRKAVSLRLANAGYRVEAVANGEDALLACSPSPPDVVILDVSMPGIRGDEVCQRIRASSGVMHPAVILLTGAVQCSGLGESDQYLHRTGADFIVAKPYDPELLVKLIGEIVHQQADGGGSAEASAEAERGL
jgi:CheY-like chemotaxis protein